MDHQSLFTCGAVNTVSDGLLWVPLHFEGRSQGSFVAYAVHNLVAIVELRTKTVIRTLRVSTFVVTAIKYCSFSLLGLVVLTSACEDGSVHIWTHSCQDDLSIWKCVGSLDGLEGSTAALDCFALGENVLVAAADSKGNVIVWLTSIHEPSQIVRISHSRLPPAQMAKSLLISELPSLDATPNLLLIVGSVDARIHLFAAKASEIAKLKSSIDATSPVMALFTPAGVVSGHEEWVTCLSALHIDSKSMFVASGSQDSKIRVWQIKAQLLGSCSTNDTDASVATDNISTELEVEDDAVEGEVIVEVDEDELESEARLKFVVEGVQYAVLLESLLVGHEDWVTSVTWMPSIVSQGSEEVEYRLFSTSMDRNMVIWSPDASAGGVWVPSVRMGDIGGALGGSIGGNLLGFVGGCVSPSGASLMGVGYGGSFHLWTQDDFSQDGEKGRWAPVPFGSGHFGSVNDLCWCDDVSGPYLTTISADQTCRIFAPLLASLADSGYSLASDIVGSAADTNSTGANQVWREISRPQIHGYDLNCLAQVPHAGVHVLYTAGEEKLIRVFDAPATVLRGLEKLAGIIQSPLSQETSRIEQAYIPELGLSNKAQEFMSKQEQTEQEARSVSRISWTAPPLESQLADFTLWPETDKMFGHNNEVMCMAISPNGAFIASASKARDAGTAQVLLWGRPLTAAASAGASAGGSAVSGVMQLLRKLPGHESTAVCLEFSPDNRFLASSGKDRSLCLYAHNPSTNTFDTVVIKKSAHKRIVWGCSWTQDGSHLITVARDGIVKVWRLVLQTHETGAQQVLDLLAVHSFSPFAGAAVTAVDVCRSGPLGVLKQLSVPEQPSGDLQAAWLVALGAESGDMQVWRVGTPSYASTGSADNAEKEGDYVSHALLTVPDAHAHGATVRRLRWRPQTIVASSNEGGNEASWELASCGEDRTVRVHRFSMNH